VWSWKIFIYLFYQFIRDTRRRKEIMRSNLSQILFLLALIIILFVAKFNLIFILLLITQSHQSQFKNNDCVSNLTSKSNTCDTVRLISNKIKLLKRKLILFFKKWHHFAHSIGSNKNIYKIQFLQPLGCKKYIIFLQ
jgi:hypothetical protein